MFTHQVFNESSSVFALYLSIPSNPPCSISISDRMKINDLKMATPIEEKVDQNLKVSVIYFGFPSSPSPEALLPTLHSEIPKNLKILEDS